MITMRKRDIFFPFPDKAASTFIASQSSVSPKMRQLSRTNLLVIIPQLFMEEIVFLWSDLCPRLGRSQKRAPSPRGDSVALSFGSDMQANEFAGASLASFRVPKATHG